MKDPDEVFRKDLITTLVTWVGLEILCFGVMPATGAINAEAVSPWLVPSVAAGLAGTVAIAFASRALISTELIMDAKTKDQNRMLLKGLSFLGFIGIAMPLFIGGSQFLESISKFDWNNWGKEAPK